MKCRNCDWYGDDRDRGRTQRCCRAPTPASLYDESKDTMGPDDGDGCYAFVPRDALPDQPAQFMATDAMVREIEKAEAEVAFGMTFEEIVRGTIPRLDLVVAMQRRISMQHFGPGDRAKALVDHIRKELVEVEAAPSDPEEWVDVLLLALDGLWRCGLTDEQAADAIMQKQVVVSRRQYPDWRTAPPDRAIEHIRDEGGA